MHLGANYLKRALVWLTLISLIVQAGCSTTPRPTPTMEVRQQLGTVAIIPTKFAPKTKLDTFAKSKSAGAAKGAALCVAFGVGMLALTFGHLVGTTPPVGELINTPGTPFLGITGGVLGWQESMHAKAVQELEAAINAANAKQNVQLSLAEHLATIIQKDSVIRLSAVKAIGESFSTESSGYDALRAMGIDTVLEIAVSEFGFENALCGFPISGWDHEFCKDKTEYSLIFTMHAQARLVRVADGAELFVQQYHYNSSWRDFAQWMNNDGQRLAEEFEVAFQALADKMNEEMFLVTPIALPLLAYGDSKRGICWLAPVYPKEEYVISPQTLFSKTDDYCPLAPMSFGIVDSLRPTLRWSSFPRDLDRKKLDPALLQKVSDISYDLKIWEVEGCARGKLVYENTGMNAAKHQLEYPLKPGQRYYWTFRARFKVDNQHMATSWAFFDQYGCYPDNIKDWMYYRFVTPQ